MHEREGPPRARIPKCAARRYSSDRADTALTLPPLPRAGEGMLRHIGVDQNVLLMPAEIQRAENGSMPALPLPNARQPERCR